jgi:hypothetical protein
MLPKTKVALLKREPGRPSARRTTLAILRHSIKVEKVFQRKIFRKRTGQEEMVRKIKHVTLPVSVVAEWLNIPVDRVRCIERGRKGYRLTEENAEKLAYQTGVSPECLLAGNGSEPVKLHWREGTKKNPYGTGFFRPYTQKDFEERQRALSNSDSNRALERDLEHARMTVAFSCAKIAAILARGIERGEADECAMKLNRALRSVFFDKDEKATVWPGGFEPAAEYSSGHFDITPTLRALENRVRENYRKKQGEPCPDCGDGWIPCPSCHQSVACIIADRKIIKHVMLDEKTGEPVHCKHCKNRRIIPCEKCKGKGHV